MSSPRRATKDALERAAKARHFFNEVFFETRFVEAMIRANFSDFLSYGHVALRWRLVPRKTPAGNILK